MPSNDDKRPISINAAQGRRITRAVKAVEQGYTPKPRGGGAANWNPGVVRAQVTTAIPSGSFASPSDTGRAQIYRTDHTGMWRPSGDPVKVYNDHGLGGSVAVDKTVKLVWIAGQWWLLAADC